MSSSLRNLDPYSLQTVLRHLRTRDLASVASTSRAMRNEARPVLRTHRTARRVGTAWRRRSSQASSPATQAKRVVDELLALLAVAPAPAEYSATAARMGWAPDGPAALRKTFGSIYGVSVRNMRFHLVVEVTVPPTGGNRLMITLGQGLGTKVMRLVSSRATQNTLSRMDVLERVINSRGLM
jgi:hypothetical protein